MRHLDGGQSRPGQTVTGKAEAPQPGRRRLLQAAGATTSMAGRAAMAPAQAEAAPGPAGRIDVHHHALPPAAKEWAVEAGLIPRDPARRPPWARWTLETTLATMDANGIALAISGNPINSERLGDRAQAREGIRVYNEALAGLRSDHPTRFGFFAHLPLSHVDLALAEAEHALDVLGADGVILVPHEGNKYLGDPSFEPLFEELDRRHAVIFVHPRSLPGGGVPGIPDFLADFLLDTTRAAIQLIMAGTLDRHRNVSIILAHAGGFLPYMAGRLSMATHLGTGADPAAVRAALHRFHYDVALPVSPFATPTLLGATGETQLLYGTDWPALPAPGVAEATAALDSDPALDGRLLRLITRENALRLLPGVAKRLSS